jgi:ABC-type enterochelin transport system substrate-binding protein
MPQERTPLDHNTLAHMNRNDSSMSKADRVLATAAYLIPMIVFIGVYGPSAGLGFISDDFGLDPPKPTGGHSGRV